jgi:ubiquitin-activating enzyme E1
MNVFLIGAGALGCEYLKMFALMGVATGSKGVVQCTDDDMIAVIYY